MTFLRVLMKSDSNKKAFPAILSSISVFIFLFYLKFIISVDFRIRVNSNPLFYQNDGCFMNCFVACITVNSKSFLVSIFFEKFN